MLPEAPIVLDPARGVLHRPRLEAATPDATLFGVRQQARPLEHPEMLVHPRERDAERPRELGDGRLAGGQVRQDRAPGWVCEGGEYRVKVGRRMVNHTVKCVEPASRCQVAAAGRYVSA